MVALRRIGTEKRATVDPAIGAPLPCRPTVSERPMRDPGLSEAIRAVGGVSELARQIGISQPSVSNWTRVPAERVVAVEAATGVDRSVLRPDLYGAGATGEVDEVDAARAQEYALIAALLLRSPDTKLLANLAELRGDDSPLGLAHAALAQAAAEASVDSVEREYFDLFIGFGRGELLPYGSYYLTGFLQERPLARLRDDLHAIGIVRAEGVVEPEDHAGILCEIMAGLAGGQLPAPKDSERMLFERHMRPWIARFFADLETAEAAKFYRRLGTVGRTFMEIENEAFDLPG
jgi:TorA maturation chaperone TorD